MIARSLVTTSPAMRPLTTAARDAGLLIVGADAAAMPYYCTPMKIDDPLVVGYIPVKVARARG